MIQGNRIKQATQIALPSPTFGGHAERLRRQPRSAPTTRALGVGLGRWIAAGELSIPVVAAACGLPDVIVNASVARRHEVAECAGTLRTCVVHTSFLAVCRSLSPRQAARSMARS